MLISNELVYEHNLNITLRKVYLRILVLKIVLVMLNYNIIVVLKQASYN